MRLATDYHWRNLDFQFGFAISTGSPHQIADNAEDQGIALNSEVASTLGKDALQVERNVMAALRAAGLQLSDEGHDANERLIGTAWITGDKPAAWHAVAWSVYHDEPLSTSSGHIMKVPGMDRLLWQGVSTLGQRLLDVSVSFFQAQAIRDFVDEFTDSDT